MALRREGWQRELERGLYKELLSTSDGMQNYFPYKDAAWLG